MKRSLLALLATLILPLLSFAQDTADTAVKTIDDRINEVFSPITATIEKIIFFTVTIGDFTIPFVLIWLIVGAIIFSIYMGFIQFSAFRHALDVVRGKYDDPNDQGEVSHFQALTAALSGTVRWSYVLP